MEKSDKNFFRGEKITSTIYDTLLENYKEYMIKGGMPIKRSCKLALYIDKC